MSDKPLYYGKPSEPIYYASSKTPAYGGETVGYYAGGRSPYGNYGGMSGGDGEDGSIVGTITLARMLRVFSQRWLTIFVFLLLGLIASFAIYRISPTIYEAKSEFSMDIGRNRRGNSPLDQAMPELGDNYTEVFNTRLSDWRSKKILTMIIQAYRTNNPASTTSDEEIMEALVDSKLELQRNSRIISISVRSTSAKLAADLANAYAQAIEAFTDEENRARCDKAVANIHAQVEKKRREKEKLSKQLLEFRTLNKVDNLRSRRDTIQQSLQKTTADILALETAETQLVEWEKTLRDVQKAPENFGSLASGVPRAQEIAEEYRAFQDASMAYAALQLSYTENHPEVMAKKKELEMSRQRFLDATERALQTGIATLRVTRNQLASLYKKQEELRAELSSVEQRIVFAESGLSTMESEFEIAGEVLTGLILDENKARLEQESNNEMVRVGCVAEEPEKPVLPNPYIIFGAGIVLSVALGFLFVLVVDNLEDTIVNLSDIEGRLALKVLAVLPHVRQRTRERVARTLISDKFSRFSEAVAGLRNLLDSPRYETMSHCLLIISTQPGEGKTITSTSLATSYAQAGRRVLHVDFDLRRPRLARVWGVELAEDKSFSHVLQRAGKDTVDFSKLVNHIPDPGIDVICSLPPEGVSPATIFGSRVMRDFFAWARANYDHIIVDAPPFGLVGDVVSLAALVDGVLVMCCPDRTHFKSIQHCVRTLAESGANILGVVVNDVEVSSELVFNANLRHGYGYKRYGGYGYGYGYRPRTRSEKGRPSAVAKGAARENVPGDGKPETVKPQDAAADDGTGDDE